MAHRCKLTTRKLYTLYLLYPSLNAFFLLLPKRISHIHRSWTWSWKREEKNFHFLERKYGKAVASRERNSWTLQKRKRCTTQTFRPANKRDEQQGIGRGEGRKGASVKGKKFEHFARFEARFERKVLRATGHLHTIPLLPRTIKANRDPGWPVSLSRV